MKTNTVNVNNPRISVKDKLYSFWGIHRVQYGLRRRNQLPFGFTASCSKFLTSHYWKNKS